MEDIFDREIIGFRAPNAYFANWMVPLLAQLGFRYDSSVVYNSFYNKTNVVLRNIPTMPYRINSETLGQKNPDSDLYELPWSYYKLSNKIILPGGGAFFFRLMGFGYFKKVIDQALKKGDTMFYLHPLDISQKRVPLANPRHRPFFWINKGIRTERNLIKLLSNYSQRFKTCKEIYERHIDEKIPQNS
ncbi:MAG: DUF3473 domain-containing protein [Candidatus Cloacimonetes bacterium]|nr:DUF3473 domain-containing protein [Candidatus Cloacimonadota bacterium]